MANEADKIKKHQQQIIKEIGNMVTIMGVEAKNHYVKSFRDSGFTDGSFKRWKPRKGEVSGFGVSKKSKGGRAILVKSGDLRRSVRVISKSQFTVTLGSDLLYAQIHNDGGIVYRRASKKTAIRTIKIRGGYSQLGDEKRRRKKMQILGVRHNVSSYSFKMPKRQFIGASRQLSVRLYNRFDKRIQSIFK